MSRDIVYTKLQETFPGAEIHVDSPRGDDHHLSATIVSSCFEGRSLLERQRLILNTFKEEFNQFLHALQVNAWTPAEHKEKQNGNSN